MEPATQFAQSDTAAPTGRDRLESLDFIRGIAVMGILAANIVAFGQSFPAYIYPAAFEVPHSAAEDWMWVAQLVLVDGKMRGLFTLLFGAGMLLFLDRAWAAGKGRSLQVRRLLWLAVFGLIHFFFLWRGDILFGYATLGLVALLFVKLPPHKQMAIGITGYLVGVVAYAAMMGAPQIVADTPVGDQPQFSEMREGLQSGMDSELADAKAESPLLREGRYGEWVAHNFSAHGSMVLVTPILFSLETIPLMLIGMALYRYGLFNGGIDRGKMRRWGWTGVIVGSLVTLAIGLWAKAGGLTYYGTMAAMLGWSPLPRLAMVMGLASLLALWSAHANGWLGERVKAAGRAAFTNYLGTSMMMVLVFHGWALGLYGELGRSALYLVVLAAWIVMLAWSKPWLERFRYGPLEWLWRCLTYGRLFPLRR